MKMNSRSTDQDMNVQASIGTEEQPWAGQAPLDYSVNTSGIAAILYKYQGYGKVKQDVTEGHCLDTNKESSDNRQLWLRSLCKICSYQAVTLLPLFH